MNEQNNDSQNAQNIQLTDLEPHDDVKGGGGARISKVVIDNDNPNTTYSGTTVSGSNTWAGNITLSGNSLLSGTYGRGTFSVRLG